MGQRGGAKWAKWGKGAKWGGGKSHLTKRFNWEICPPGVTITQGGAFFVVKNLRSPKKFQKISESPKKFRKKVVLILKKKLWSEQRL